MTKHYDGRFQKDIVTVHPGEYFTSDEDLYIATILGSCISVALFDQKLQFGGINHFMLPCATRSESLFLGDEGRFGDYAMELLINDMIKKGANRSRMCAKIFGGSAVLEGGVSQTNKTGIHNINFTMQFLEVEKIPLLVNDTGGIFPRKIYFHPQTAKVYVKRIQPSRLTVQQIARREALYEEALKKEKAQAGDITWF